MCTHSRGAGREVDDRGDRFNRHLPPVAGDVPIQLVVLVEEAEGVRHAVLQLDGPRRVHRARDPDLQLAIVALAAGFIFRASDPRHP